VLKIINEKIFKKPIFVIKYKMLDFLSKIESLFLCKKPLISLQTLSTIINLMVEPYFTKTEIFKT